MKKTILVLLSIGIGILLGFLIAELFLRFYLFGFSLQYRDNRIIDENLFSKDKKHIFFIGDSFTQGYPYSADQSYPVYLENVLQDKSIKITNFASGNCGVYDQINIVRQISKLEPSLIVWGLSTNDILTPKKDRIDLSRLSDYPLFNFPKEIPRKNYFKDIFFTLPRDCFKRKMSAFSTLKEMLGRCSYVYLFLSMRFQEKTMFKFLKARNNRRYDLEEIRYDEMEYYKKGGEYPDPILEAIVYVRNFLNEEKIDFIVFYVPQESDLNDRLFFSNVNRQSGDIKQYDRTRPRKIVEQFCLRNGILFIDPSDELAAQIDEGKKLFIRINRHYNHYGNILMAKILSRNKKFLLKKADK